MKNSRISLRWYERSDIGAVSALFADADVMRFVGDGSPIVEPAVNSLFEKIFLFYRTDSAVCVWAVCEDGQYAGHAELKRRKGRTEYELIYIIERDRWGRSVGSRAVDLILARAQYRDIPFVIATVNTLNAASIAILKRRGFEADPKLSAELHSSAYRLNLDAKNDGS